MSSLPFEFGQIFFQWVGFLVIAYYVLNYLKSIYRAFCLPKVDMANRYGEKSWALVTGASDGIGKGFCQELARKGFNIILIARNPEKLKTVQLEIMQEFKNVQVVYYVYDFSLSSDPSFFQRLYDDVKSYDVSLLVNNVGLCETEEFLRISEKSMRDIITINCFPMVFMTYYMLPQMLKREKKSAVINISSAVIHKYMPYWAVYGSTKAYGDYFSQTLANEYEGTKIDFMSLQAAFVQTNMYKSRKTTFTILNPRQCAQGCFDYLTHETASPGHWRHQLTTFFAKFTPMFKIKQVLMNSLIRKRKRDELRQKQCEN